MEDYADYFGGDEFHREKYMYINQILDVAGVSEPEDAAVLRENNNLRGWRYLLKVRMDQNRGNESVVKLVQLANAAFSASEKYNELLRKFPIYKHESVACLKELNEFLDSLKAHHEQIEP